MLNGSGSSSWRLSLKLESSLCPGLGGQCPGACKVGRCVEAEKRTTFAVGRIEAQVWREEEAGLEEAGCLAERSCLGILAVRSCVSLPGLCPSRLFLQRPEPGRLRNDGNFSLLVLEAGKIQVRVLKESVFVEGPFPVSSCGGRGEGATWVLS